MTGSMNNPSSIFFCPVLNQEVDPEKSLFCPVLIGNGEPAPFCPTCRRLQAWVAATPDLLCLINREGIYKDVVPGKEVPAIMPPDKLIGKNAAEVGDPEIGRMTVEKAREAMDTGQMVLWSFQFPGVPTGKYEARFTPSGEDECLVLVRDVSIEHADRSQLEEAVEKRTSELQASNDELRQFAYAASHDLREPLGKIKAFGSRLAERYGEALDERGQEYLGVMRSAADRMMQLIDDLLEYSRVGRNENEFEDVDLSVMITEVLSLFSERIAGAKIHVPDELPTIRGDKGQCYTLFQNLISNSLKFSKPDKPAKIWITTSTEDCYEIVEIRDEGIGFEPEYADRIFLIFERLHTRFDYPGTGIGLALCRRIVERHGGFISAEGHPNEGAVFRVGFPRRLDGPQAP